MARFAVTGGAGFIGSHLVDRLLAEGNQVVVLDDFSTGKRDNLDPMCEVVTGDVCDGAAVQEVMEGAAGCFHLAAIASVARANENPVATHRVNQTGTVTVLEVARRCGRVPVVYASSAAVYGDLGQCGAASEEMLPAPLSAYGADKFGSEMHARAAFAVHGVPTLGCRFFNVYGPRQDPSSPYSGVISIFLSRAGAGLPLRIYGDGEQTRDFVYVADVVEHLLGGMAYLAVAPGCEVFNVCTGQATSILGLVKTIGAVFGTVPAVEFAPARPGDIRASVGDPLKARGMLYCRAEIGLQQGLSRLAGATPPVPTRSEAI